MLLLVSFNPCCIGRYAKRLISCLDEGQGLSFNPCCIGRYAKSVLEPITFGGEIEFQSLLYWKIC